MSAKGLGKGFGSLLPSDFDDSLLVDKNERIHKILISDIKADPTQPRKSFDPKGIQDLASSIKTHGILQPLVLIESSDGYMIVAGERRLRAAKQADLKHVPALIRSLEELERLEVSLIENVQRVDLSPLEQAASIARLNEQFSMSYQEIADRLGKAFSTVVNITRLLGLPDFARDALVDGKISEGHARSVLAFKDNEALQKELVDNIINHGWSVRRAEQFVSDKKAEAGAKPGDKATAPLHPMAASISKKVGADVRIQETKKGGKIQLTFKTKEALAQFLERLTK